MKAKEPRLTERMRAVLATLDKAGRPLPPNMIGHRLGFHTGHLPGNAQCNHAGRVMGPAQRVIFTLIALRNLGLVRCGSRSDGLSGTAYEITGAGRAALK